MSGSIERRLDGSIALTIDGDLQFDSSDEHIYHEGLVLPALGIALNRTAEPLNVLIIGGGDGLSAKQVFKCERIKSATLVDYDAEILSMARSEFAEINERSMLDARLTVANEDAWTFAENAVRKSEKYNLIIVDLTVADEVESAKFHSVEWYTMLKTLLSGHGILATNGVSPQATPWSYCSILNTILISELQARPYHVAIPSFAARGYGDDWGFFLASGTPITVDELTAADMPQPRTFLASKEKVSELFDLPESLFEIQPMARPALAGSDVLIRYFRAGNLIDESGAKKNAFTLNFNALSIPQADTGKDVLPKEITAALAKMLSAESRENGAEATSQEAVLEELLELVPSLATSQTPELVRDFLSQPAAFLQSVDIADLVSRLTERVSALPANLAAELKLLAQKLSDWKGDQLSLMQMGRNVVMLLSLILIVGNLLYPDMVYAKGDHGHGRGGRGGGWNDGWGGGGVEYYNRRQRDVIINPQGAPVPARRGPAGPEIKNYGNKRKSALPDAQKKVVQELDETINMLAAEVEESRVYSMLLLDELTQYKNSKAAVVSYGLSEVSKDDAIRRTQQLVNKARLKIVALNQQIADVEEQRDEIILACKSVDTMLDKDSTENAGTDAAEENA